MADDHRRLLCVDLCVCAGGCAYSNLYVGPTATGLLISPVQKSGAGAAIWCCRKHMQLADSAMCARFWSRLQVSGRYFQCRDARLGLLRRAGTGHGPHVLVVSRAAQAMLAHAERCRARPVYGSRKRWSGTDFAEYFRAPQSKSVDKRHFFVIYMMSVKYSMRGFNFQCQGPEI